MAQETLTCQHGKGHKWTRETTRGRKPPLCPKHRETPAESKSKPRSSAPVRGATIPAPKRATETLTCLTGGHSWERVSARGKKPTHCPTHKLSRPVVAPANKPKPVAPVAGQETLTCQQGHEWTRVITRGRKPVLCPAHATVKPAPVKREPGAVSLAPVAKGPLTELEEYIAQRDAANAIRWAKEAKAKDRIDNLETMLRSSGHHLSQNSLRDDLPEWLAKALAVHQPVKATGSKKKSKGLIPA